MPKIEYIRFGDTLIKNGALRIPQFNIEIPFNENPTPRHTEILSGGFSFDHDFKVLYVDNPFELRNLESLEAAHLYLTNKIPSHSIRYHDNKNESGYFSGFPKHLQEHVKNDIENIIIKVVLTGGELYDAAYYERCKSF